jgi:DNA-binding transcriptional ArsR family regulator
VSDTRSLASDVQVQTHKAAAFLKQFANEKRLLILGRLTAGEAGVTELCDITGLSQSAMSQHLAKMRNVGLVSGRQRGLQVFYSITDERCLAVLETIEREFYPSSSQN